MSQNKIKMSLKDVYKSFGSNHVLRGVNLDIQEGESMVVIGGSGTGKSVMLKCILNLLSADKGSIKVDDLEMVGAKRATVQAIRSKIGMLFQGGALFDSLPVWHNICFELLQTDRTTPKEARDIAAEKLKAVGLSADNVEKFPAELSGGMQKRVSLARAIAAEPEIIFFDEPTTGLDPIMAEVINELILKCVRDLGATALTITHDMESVRRIADRVSLIHQGEILWTGDIDQLDKSKNDFVDQFIHGRAEGPIKVG